MTTRPPDPEETWGEQRIDLGREQTRFDGCRGCFTDFFIWTGVLLAAATLVSCGDDNLVEFEVTPTLRAATEAIPVSPTRASSSPNLSQFDPPPVPLDPSSEPCEPNRQYVVLRIGGGDLLGACATWDDTWTDELGFVMRVELFGERVETVHYLLPPGAEGMVVAEDYRPSCDRPAFRFTLFVLLPAGPEFVDTGGRQGICDGG